MKPNIGPTLKNIGSVALSANVLGGVILAAAVSVATRRRDEELLDSQIRAKLEPIRIAEEVRQVRLDRLKAVSPIPTE
jgi:hypothetical protein